MRKVLFLFVCLCVFPLTTNTISAQEIKMNSGTRVVDVPVQTTVNSTFTVKLPVTIELIENNKEYGYSGNVGVKGNLMVGASVAVTTDTNIIMYDVTNRTSPDIPLSSTDQPYQHKLEKTVSISMDNILHNSLSNDNYTTSPFSLNAGEMEAGKWRGSLTFNIQYNKPDRSGLYDENGVRIATWNELVEEGTIHYTNGVVATNVDMDTYTNSSADRLTGKIVLPDDAVALSPGAFAACSNLTGVLIPEGITEVPYGAFYDCTSLVDVEIPESVVVISDGAFTYNESLEQVKLPRNLTSLGLAAFGGCTSLRNINIPDTLETLGEEAFSLCRNLEAIYLPDSLTSIGNKAFNQCSSIKSISIPDSVNQLGDSAFNMCTELETIKLPNNISYLGNYLFSGCERLKEVEIPSSVHTIGEFTFNHCISLTSIVVPEGVISLPGTVFNECTALKDVTLPDSITSVGENLFKDCVSLSSVNIPKGLTVLPHGMFMGCHNLKNIEIPSSIIKIEDFVFYETAIKELYVPDTVLTMYNNAFADVNHVTTTNPNIPAEMPRVNGYREGDFIYYDNSKRILVAYVGYDPVVTIPSGVTTIEHGAFSGDKDLTDVIMPDTLTTIRPMVFNRCTNIEDLKVPSSVTTIHSGAFKDLPHVTYTGTATDADGNNWGAKSMN